MGKRIRTSATAVGSHLQTVLDEPIHLASPVNPGQAKVSALPGLLQKARPVIVGTLSALLAALPELRADRAFAPARPVRGLVEAVESS